MDGKLENDAEDAEKRRPLLATTDLFVDHHVRRHTEQVRLGDKPVPEHLIPLTGAQLSTVPEYRLLSQMDATSWGRAYAKDYKGNISVGQMHVHKDTCFKYVKEKTYASQSIAALISRIS